MVVASHFFLLVSSSRLRPVSFQTEDTPLGVGVVGGGHAVSATPFYTHQPFVVPLRASSWIY